MGLYGIMLVDDEEEVRKAIIRKMDWEQLGFYVAGDAENGQDALEKVEILEPDVVMTDIRSSLASSRIEGRASPADRAPTMICSLIWSVICS